MVGRRKKCFWLLCLTKREKKKFQDDIDPLYIGPDYSFHISKYCLDQANLYLLSKSSLLTLYSAGRLILRRTMCGKPRVFPRDYIHHDTPKALPDILILLSLNIGNIGFPPKPWFEKLKLSLRGKKTCFCLAQGKIIKMGLNLKKNTTFWQTQNWSLQTEHYILVCFQGHLPEF